MPRYPGSAEAKARSSSLSFIGIRLDFFQFCESLVYCLLLANVLVAKQMLVQLAFRLIVSPADHTWRQLIPIMQFLVKLVIRWGVNNTSNPKCCVFERWAEPGLILGIEPSFGFGGLTMTLRLLEMLHELLFGGKRLTTDQSCRCCLNCGRKHL
ncbi:uncharacterized protein M421DRAFT_298558 [Didymella exigua CBS 183.55]|uniref:Uncharacterized protein n=1 Tax=Didymella exigua CBS 183.55 TaxID=1150837 RepID=A0A6A5R8R2_9PLEO|nr:uncharacterized protein M421DRAFT_298558 [Didymella exigua CBS 183.55]KAF1924122.1 hypothetical protein M421DRAFT_298558 [Didymella exigua CBS 183.55]